VVLFQWHANKIAKNLRERVNCSILRATANPVEVIVARTEQGRGVMGVIDGSSPKGIEGPAEISARKEFLRKLGYKR